MRLIQNTIDARARILSHYVSETWSSWLKMRPEKEQSMWLIGYGTLYEARKHKRSWREAQSKPRLRWKALIGIPLPES